MFFSFAFCIDVSSNVADTLKDNILDSLPADIPSDILENIVDLKDLPVERLETLPVDFVDGILPGVDEALGGLDGALDGVTDAMSGVTDSISGVTDAISGVTDGINDAISSVTDGLNDAISGITDGLNEALSGITDQISQAFDSVSELLGSFKDKLSSLFTGAGNCHCTSIVKKMWSDYADIILDKLGQATEEVWQAGDGLIDKEISKALAATATTNINLKNAVADESITNNMQELLFVIKKENEVISRNIEMQQRKFLEGK